VVHKLWTVACERRALCRTMHSKIVPNRVQCFSQRAFAANFAMRERSLSDNAAARALPPFDAPSFESATAAGFFFLSDVLDISVKDG